MLGASYDVSLHSSPHEHYDVGNLQYLGRLRVILDSRPMEQELPDRMHPQSTLRQSTRIRLVAAAAESLYRVIALQDGTCTYLFRHSPMAARPWSHLRSRTRRSRILESHQIPGSRRLFPKIRFRFPGILVHREDKGK